ncbi:MAG: UvrB/UvrC motif-containing protein [Oscillospiraceae bacterium]|nr:UvrB/UvrC motif-containing protein [Oscillospiraceae bacterium]
MICQKCGSRNAEVHYKTNFNGALCEFILCPECAEKLEQDTYFGVNYFNKMLSSFMSPIPHKRTVRCPLCGTSEDEILKTGKAGCPKCYETFEEIFIPFIKRINGSTKHTGKTPASAGKELEEKHKLKELKDSLNKAVKAQDFEKAAELRDSIKELEGGNQA